MEETDRILREIEKLITKIPEVETYSRRTGTQMGFFITEPNKGDYLIQLKRDRKKTTADIITEIRQKTATQPALRTNFGQVIGDMLGYLMTSVQPIEVKIFGDNQQKQQELSRKVTGVVSHVIGTADVFDGVVIAGPSVSVQPDLAKLAQFGITPANFQYQQQTSLEGNVMGGILEKEQLSNIRIIYPNSRKFSVADINQLRFFLPSGKLKPIAELATIQVN